MNGCKLPHKCATEALTQLNDIIPQLNPVNLGNPHNNLSLTHHQKAKNTQTREENDKILFDLSITYKDDLTECLQTQIEYPQPQPIDHT